ncbi:Flp pilus assembly protein CpaB [Endozoicomonadaceae bacterium StTr2]
MDRRILLVIAFLLCAGGIFGLLNQPDTPEPQPETSTAVTPPQERPRIQVWVATKDYKLGDSINPSDLEPRSLLLDKARELGVTTEKVLQLEEGMLAGSHIRTGTIVAEHQLLRPGQPAFIDYMLRPDKVPYPLTIDGNKGYNGSLVPGDRVDVVLISSPGRNLADKPVGDSYQGLEVTPVLNSRRIVDVREPSAMSSQMTVTIALRPEDVSKMIVASRIGLLDVYKSTTQAVPAIRVEDVLPEFTTIVEMRADQRDVHYGDARLNIQQEIPAE